MPLFRYASVFAAVPVVSAAVTVTEKVADFSMVGVAGLVPVLRVTV